MNVRQLNCRNLLVQWIMWDVWLVKLSSNWLVLLVVMPLDLGCLFFWIYLVGSSILCWLVLPVVMPLDPGCLFFWICWWCILLIFFGLNLYVQSQGEDGGLKVDYFTFSPHNHDIKDLNWYFRSFEVITTICQFYCIKSLVFDIAIIVVKDLKIVQVQTVFLKFSHLWMKHGWIIIKVN